jgi:hypothetical protein
VIVWTARLRGRRGARPWIRIPGAVILAAWCGASVGAQSVSPEYQLKAAFVSKFPEFTEWPAQAVESRRTIDLCVARPNPFGRALSDFTAGEAIRGRPLQVREITGPGEIASCHVLFVPADSALDRRALLAAARKLPVLTVGEAAAFLDEGGILRLDLVDGRVRFDVNVAAANRVGVRFSSQLLRLAMHVRGQP